MRNNQTSNPHSQSLVLRRHPPGRWSTISIKNSWSPSPCDHIRPVPFGCLPIVVHRIAPQLSEIICPRQQNQQLWCRRYGKTECSPSSGGKKYLRVVVPSSIIHPPHVLKSDEIIGIHFSRMAMRRFWMLYFLLHGTTSASCVMPAARSSAESRPCFCGILMLESQRDESQRTHLEQRGAIVLYWICFHLSHNVADYLALSIIGRSKNVSHFFSPQIWLRA